MSLRNNDPEQNKKKFPRMLLFPGWAVPPRAYKDFPAEILDPGFFGSKADFDLRFPEAVLAGDPAPAVLAGHSLGAYFALRTALAHQVKALVLFSPFANFTKSPSNPDGQLSAVLEIMIRRLEKDPATLLDEFHKSLFAPEKRKCWRLSGFNRESMRTGLEILLESDISDRIADIKCPVLAISGSKDRIVKHSLSEKTALAMPSCTLAKIAGAGHGLPFTRTESCLKIIEEFLK